MKRDVLAWGEGRRPEKVVSKETLNHRGIIELVGGIDVYQDTVAAYREAYKRLGIDIINRVPLVNALPPTPSGSRREHPEHSDYTLLPLGVFDTAIRHKYPCQTPGDVWNRDVFDIDSLDYDRLVVPVPHSCRGDDIQQREEALGEIGLYYPMLYTTLFMWGVETLGWEQFMLAAMSNPTGFYESFLVPCARKSQQIIDEVANSSCSPFLFIHDDLADSRGPVFRPHWYDENIFPLYCEILKPAFAVGKKIVFVADGNMTVFLPRLREIGVSGIMFENPATPLEAVIEHFGDAFMIGGIDTAKLTFGTPKEVQRMVYDLFDRMSGFIGFAISSCGGLHGNIPMDNLIAYFQARADIGATPKDWMPHIPSPIQHSGTKQSTGGFL